MAAPLKLPPIPDPGPDSNSQFQTLLALKHTVDRIVLELTGASTAGVIDKAVNPTDITNSTTVGRSVITAPDASAARSNLGLAGYSGKNRIINGAMAVDQRNAGASQTITAGAALAYTVDRWYAYCTGANATGQRVQGASAGLYRYKFTGAASVTGIGFGQRIESINSVDLAGKTATLSVDLSNSVLTTVTWTAYYANTADTFGTLASPTRTQIATGTFTVNSTVSRYSAQISIPAAATTGIEIVFSVGAQTSGTWQVGDVEFEEGSIATPFERRQFGQELVLCQRYYTKSYNLSEVPGSSRSLGAAAIGIGSSNGYTSGYVPIFFPARMRADPTVTVYDCAGTAGKYTYYNGGWANDGWATVIGAWESGALIQPVGSVYYGVFEYTARAEL